MATITQTIKLSSDLSIAMAVLGMAKKVLVGALASQMGAPSVITVTEIDSGKIRLYYSDITAQDIISDLLEN